MTFEEQLKTFRSKRKPICSDCVAKFGKFMSTCSGCHKTDGLYKEIFESDDDNKDQGK